MQSFILFLCMSIFFILLWLIDRFAWKHTKVLGQIEDQHDFDFINKFSMAMGPKINVTKLRHLATANSNVRLFEVSDQDMAKSLQSMQRSHSMLMHRRQSSAYPKVSRRDSGSSTGSWNSNKSHSSLGKKSRFNFKSSRSMWKSIRTSDNSLLGEPENFQNVSRASSVAYSARSGYSTRRSSICIEPTESSIAEV